MIDAIHIDKLLIEYHQIYNHNIDDFDEIFLESIPAVNPRYMNCSVIELTQYLAESKKAIMLGLYSGFVISYKNIYIGIVRYKLSLSELYLDTIYVKEEYRNKGVASYLIEYLLFNEPSVEFVIAIPSHDVALFTKNGFVESNLYNDKFGKKGYELNVKRPHGHFDIDHSNVNETKKSVNKLIEWIKSDQIQVLSINEKKSSLAYAKDLKRHWKFSNSISHVIEIIENEKLVNPQMIHLLFFNLFSLGVYGKAYKLLSVFLNTENRNNGKMDNALREDLDVFVFALTMFMKNNKKVLENVIIQSSNNKYSSQSLSSNNIKRIYEEYNLQKYKYCKWRC